MARRRAIEADELFETANRLQAEGKEVTAVALLDALGGGSLRTIYKHLETWKQRRPAAATQTSDEIPGPVLAGFVNAWRLAAQERDRQIAAVNEKADEEVSAALKQFEEARNLIEKLESESEADSQQIEGLQARVAELEAALHKSESETIASKATAEQLIHQVKAQQLELDRVHKEIDQDRTHHQEQIAKMTADQERAQSKSIEQLQQANASVLEAQQKNEQSERERLQLQIKLEQLEQETKRFAASKEQADKERDASVKESAELKGRLEAMSTQNEQLLAALADRQSPEKRKPKTE